MLGLNRGRTDYTITATHYKFKGVEANIQTWEAEGHKFKCKFSSQVYVQTVSSNQGIPKPSMSIETASAIDFKINDKVSINGQTYLVKDISLVVDPFSGKYTNVPQDYIKMITLQ